MMLLPAALAGSPTPQRVEAIGMEVVWRVEGELLTATVRAPTTGWVALGLHTRPGLDGCLLLMGAVVDGELRLEEHVAQPPRHPPRVSLGGRAGLRGGEGVEDAQSTTITFRVDLSVHDAVAPTLTPGQPAWLTLAWSHEDDFNHHSARRTELAAPDFWAVAP